MSRYNSIGTILNDSEHYKELRKKRGVKVLEQYPTIPMHHPGLIERAMLATEPHIWSVGDHFYKLAHEYYSESKYWWVIAWYNGYPTEGDIKKGAVIDIPLDLEKALIALGM
jgi:hypothetical protein